MTHSECRDLFGSSRTLLVKSGLVSYSGSDFVANDNECEFENYWARTFDAEFGRYMAWVWFSVGAENLVKSALVCCTPLTGRPIDLGYPVFSHKLDKASWVDKVLQPQKGAFGTDEAQKHEYCALGTIWDTKIYDLARRCNIPNIQSDELKAAYKYLTQVIRNRDAHSYVKKQRRKDFPAVEGIFVPAFNTLVKTMENNGHFTVI